MVPGSSRAVQLKVNQINFILFQFHEITHLTCSPAFSGVRFGAQTDLSFRMKPVSAGILLREPPHAWLEAMRGKEENVPPRSTYYIGWYNVHTSISPAGVEQRKYGDNTRVTLKNISQQRQWEQQRSNAILLYLDNKHYYVLNWTVSNVRSPSWISFDEGRRQR